MRRGLFSMPAHLRGFVAWPDDVATRYRELGLWTGQTFGRLLRQRARSRPDKLAVIDHRGRWSYAELDARSDALAAGFARRGVAPGDRVMVQMPNIAEFVEVVFALFRLGALPVFALPAHRRAELTAIAARAEAVAVVVAREHGAFDHAGLAVEVAAAVDTIRDVFVVLDPDDGGDAPHGTTDLAALRVDEPYTGAGPEGSDVAFLQLSGGSTGIPKLIARTHDDYLYSVRRSAEICGLTEDSVYLATLPVAHNFPMSSPGILGAIFAGGTIALTPQPAPEVAFAMIERAGVTITGVVPPLARLWVDAALGGQPHDLSSLEVLLVGGARCPDELAVRVGPALGVTLQQVFGMAEGLVCYTRLDDPPDVITTTQGRPMSPHDELRVVDEHDVDLPAGSDGFLLTRGPYTIRGYFGDPDANERAFTSDGWYRTGDIVRLTGGGNLVVLGRAADRVNRGGEKVSAEELEEALLGHDDVHDAVVVAIPDAHLGERTCAFLIPVDPVRKLRLAEIRAFVRGRGLAEWKVPDKVVLLERFPETGVGKTSRRRLRELLAAGAR